MEQRLGGCFSKKWGGMPAESDVSAPDSNLLEAGVSLADVGGAGGAAAGDGVTAAAGDAALDAAAAGDGGDGTAAGAAAVAGEGDDELTYRGEPTSGCKWSESAAGNKNLSERQRRRKRRWIPSGSSTRSSAGNSPSQAMSTWAPMARRALIRPASSSGRTRRSGRPFRCRRRRGSSSQCARFARRLT